MHQEPISSAKLPLRLTKPSVCFLSSTFLSVTGSCASSLLRVSLSFTANFTLTAAHCLEPRPPFNSRHNDDEDFRRFSSDIGQSRRCGSTTSKDRSTSDKCDVFWRLCITNRHEEGKWYVDSKRSSSLATLTSSSILRRRGPILHSRCGLPTWRLFRSRRSPRRP